MLIEHQGWGRCTHQITIWWVRRVKMRRQKHKLSDTRKKKKRSETAFVPSSCKCKAKVPLINLWQRKKKLFTRDPWHASRRHLIKDWQNGQNSQSRRRANLWQSIKIIAWQMERFLISRSCRFLTLQGCSCQFKLKENINEMGIAWEKCKRLAIYRRLLTIVNREDKGLSGLYFHYFHPTLSIGEANQPYGNVLTSTAFTFSKLCSTAWLSTSPTSSTSGRLECRRWCLPHSDRYGNCKGHLWGGAGMMKSGRNA